MTEREFERQAAKRFPREESIRAARDAYRRGFESVFAVGEMSDEQRAIMEKNITFIR